MAITLQQTPTDFAPVYNPLIYVATSDNTTQPNFNFVFDVYIDAVLSSRHKIPTRPGSTEAVFDAAGVLRDFLSHDIDIDTDGFGTNTNSYVNYSVNIGEEYDVTGTLTLFPDLDTGIEFYTYNSVLKFRDFVNYSNGDFLLGSSADRFLTNAPSTQKMLSGNHGWLYTINDDPTVVSRMQIVELDSSGSTLATHNVSNSFTTDTDDNRFLRIGVGHQNLTDEIVAFPDTDLASYTVTIQTGAGAALSETFTFEMVEECRYTPIRLHFLNRRGGFDAISLLKRSDDNIDVTSRSKYQPPVGTLSGTAFSFDESERHETYQQILSKDRIQVFSDFLSDAEYLWLEELITSPIVFQELSGVLIPINITDNNYIKLKRVNRQIEPLRVRFEYTDIHNTQLY